MHFIIQLISYNNTIQMFYYSRQKKAIEAKLPKYIFSTYHRVRRDAVESLEALLNEKSISVI